MKACNLQYGILSGSALLACLLLFFPALSTLVLVNRMALSLLRQPAHPPSSVGLPPLLSASGPATYLQGLHLFYSGQPQAAAELLASSAAQQRRPLPDWFLARALLAANQSERAASVLAAMQLSADSLVNLALTLPEPAERSLIDLLAEQALLQQGGRPATRRWLGIWSVGHSRPEQAIALIKPVLTDEDDHLWSQLGWAYYLLGEYAQALAAFEHAVQVRPDSTLYQLRLAQAYQARNDEGDQATARHVLEKLVATSAQANAEAWFTLGWNYYLASESDAAVDAFTRALNLQPDNHYYRMRLAQALLQRAQGDDRARAVDLLRHVVAHAPDLAEAAALLQRLATP